MPLPPESLPPYYMQGNAINNRVTHNDRPWLVLVNQADPNFARDQHHEIEYDFSGSLFCAGRSKRGAYTN